MFLGMETVPEIPFGKRLNRLRTYYNEPVLIRMRTPSPAWAIRFPARSMKTKKDGMRALATQFLRHGNHEPPRLTTVIHIEFIAT